MTAEDEIEAEREQREQPPEQQAVQDRFHEEDVETSIQRPR